MARPKVRRSFDARIGGRERVATRAQSREKQAGWVSYAVGKRCDRRGWREVNSVVGKINGQGAPGQMAELCLQRFAESIFFWRVASPFRKRSTLLMSFELVGEPTGGRRQRARQARLVTLCLFPTDCEFDCSLSSPYALSR